MDLRSLRFFLAVAREKSFVRAAQTLHHTQPNVTRTVKALEDELGGPLFVRSSRGVTLTPRGEVLVKRAAEIVDLVSQTEQDVRGCGRVSGLTGDIRIAAGETAHMPRFLAAVQRTRAKHPGIRFHFHSANGEEVARRVDLGLADLGLVFEPFNLTPYAHRTLPWTENWGVIVPQNHPFASQCTVSAEDLRSVPIIVSAQMLEKNAFTAWLGCDPLSLQLACTYNLIGTALQMASQGMGALIGFEGLSTYTPHPKFLPFAPLLTASVYLIAKHGDAPKHVAAFLEELDDL